MSDEREQMALLKTRLESFEKRLRDLLHQTEEDVKLASLIQKALMPNRVSQIPGMTFHARYISAGSLSSECFDIIPTKDSRQVWILFFWTESMGLNSLLFQTLVHLQSVALIESRPRLSPEEVFNDLCMELFNSKKEGHFRLSVMRLDMGSLNLSGVSQGMGPWIYREKDRNRYPNFILKNKEDLEAHSQFLERAHSKSGLTAQGAYNFSFHLSPGSRFFMMGREWLGNESASLQAGTSALRLADLPHDKDLIDDMNHLLIHAEMHMKNHKAKFDLSCLSLEIDSKKLHLA